MKKYVRCKVCGFIMEEAELKDVCPACGVPKTAFVEHKFNINEKRQKILDLHLHPISVHFPEAIAVFILGFFILSFILPEDMSNNLLTVNKTLSIFFPITVIMAFVAGIYDAKVRFKKLSPPYLKIKIYLGIALFIGSLLMPGLFIIVSYTAVSKIFIFIVALINLGLCVVLGKMGSKLFECVMPG
ncbi:putative membrane protein [Clostridium saccharoperbutylacetonicum]|uniref:Rubredoxin-type Fe(Cys)4 protein n=1 Tax=Clostridium saccharoperbutylacetonicum N1-4(HMT) TaxID=931276 RepID=M1N4T8_9CLOT|nr:rubredoxin-type Fe(Cys)4 protein [Clostridium saccharoperbutylacetonicum]AGF58467.1 rubredoxin-type Fe(Cys)4 protein [Clostridium saccharoperbutylacetonicum N1-4(HMT)]NRT60755.1 putative membrane protein [Clostridium saccharoperbutylacetonicum]NSB24069.1 putative membrane protein [Clostridium saccharoperbutylacetonicum]NSB43447.1 putative membrane protein [Clostridium saccharoperbutylacetonicum]